MTASIVAVFGLHAADCPVNGQIRGGGPCAGCVATFFPVVATFEPPSDGDVREGIRRARRAAREQAERVVEAMDRSDA